MEFIDVDAWGPSKDNGSQTGPPPSVEARPPVSEDEKLVCKGQILSVFPDVCPEHLDILVAENDSSSDTIINLILDQAGAGNPYPKQQRATVKRKRAEDDSDGDNADGDDKYDVVIKAREYFPDTNKEIAYISSGLKILKSAFPDVTIPAVRQIHQKYNHQLLATVLHLNRKLPELATESAPKKKPKTQAEPFIWDQDCVQHLTEEAKSIHKQRALAEFSVAMRIIQEERAEEEAKKEAKARKEREELENMQKAKAEGTMADCECCFDELPLNRMIQCDGGTVHRFCHACAKRNAETQIGLSKYELCCMSMSGCTGGFSKQQRAIFLDTKTRLALERIEQEAALRMAGIDNLETCPFCPFAAEYPPRDVDKEFRCLNPDCQIVSCRFCQRETHIPISCDEAANEAGHSARHEIEEAMSAALIRKCNKCMSFFFFVFSFLLQYVSYTFLPCLGSIPTYIFDPLGTKERRR